MSVVCPGLTPHLPKYLCYSNLVFFYSSVMTVQSTAKITPTAKIPDYFLDDDSIPLLKWSTACL